MVFMGGNQQHRKSHVRVACVSMGSRESVRRYTSTQSPHKKKTKEITRRGKTQDSEADRQAHTERSTRRKVQMVLSPLRAGGRAKV